MRTHIKSFHIRFTEKEYQTLCNQSEKAGLPKSTYLRFMIKGQTPKDKPPVDYFNMMKEIYCIGNNLNQLTHLAHRFGSIHAKQLDETMEQFANLELAILDTIISPGKMDVAAVLECGRIQDGKDQSAAKNDSSSWKVKVNG